MDLRQYLRRKERGLVTLSRSGTSVQYTTARYDPDTGEQLTPTIGLIDLEALRSRRLCLEQDLRNLNLFISDVEAALSR